MQKFMVESLHGDPGRKDVASQRDGYGSFFAFCRFNVYHFHSGGGGGNDDDKQCLPREDGQDLTAAQKIQYWQYWELNKEHPCLER